MRLQTDLELLQNEIKKLNKKYNIDMFSTKFYVVEKRLLQNRKLENLKHCFVKVNGYIANKTGRLNPRKLFRNAV